jgi:quercetin dioxygenase-like cupin family protein
MQKKTIREATAFGQEKMRKHNLFETERVAFDTYCLLPGQSQSVHAHEGMDKVYHVLEGEPSVTIGGETARLAPGDVVLARSGVPHGVRNDGAVNAVLAVVLAPPPGR